jgi:hypothetical protein
VYNFKKKIYSTDLKHKRACFPTYEGAAFMAVLDTLQKLKVIANNCTSAVNHFFSDKSCFSGGQGRKCHSKYEGDDGAFRCLQESGDVAFMNLETFKKLSSALTKILIIS